MVRSKSASLTVTWILPLCCCCGSNLSAGAGRRGSERRERRRGGKKRGGEGRGGEERGGEGRGGRGEGRGGERGGEERGGEGRREGKVGKEGRQGEEETRGEAGQRGGREGWKNTSKSEEVCAKLSLNCQVSRKQNITFQAHTHHTHFIAISADHGLRLNTTVATLAPRWCFPVSVEV